MTRLSKIALPNMSNYVKDLKQIFWAGVSSVLPENLIRNSVTYDEPTCQLTVSGTKFNLKDKNVYLVGAGKAVQNMAVEIEGILGSKLKQGIVSIPVGSTNSQNTCKIVKFLEGAKNNLPDKAAETSANKIKDLVVKLGADDVLLVLISGGGSALLPSSKKPITLDEKTTSIKAIANAGADITELNIVRKRISELKGGQLAIKAQPAQVITLILSDIVGDPLDLIASGPTVENKDDPMKAIKIIEKYKLRDQIPSSVNEVLSKPVEPTQFPNHNVSNYIIGCNRICTKAAFKEAEKVNYAAFQLSNEVTGNVNNVAKEYKTLTLNICEYMKRKVNKKKLEKILKSLNIPGLNHEFINQITKIQNFKDKTVCFILGGETTVEVKGSGLGGRNQQLALEYSRIINNNKDIFKDFDIYFLSAGTDGFDGPTDAAGAIGKSNLVEEAEKEKVHIMKYLENNDTYNFYKGFKNGELHVITGHTNTNVMDLHLLIIRLVHNVS